jgi:tetratricopeptide (TPR) repeat protein
MNKKIFGFLPFIAIFAAAITLNLNAQADNVRSLLKMVAQGKSDEVKKQLPDLLAEYPNDPGVQLLFGVVIEDGNKAIEIYKKIIKNYPESEWADDAYWRIVQFYAITGDTAKAQSELESYRKKYPTSEFLAPATDVVRSAITIARNESKHKNKPSISEQKEKASAQNENPDEGTQLPSKPKNDKSLKTSGKTTTKDLDSTSKTRFGLQVGLYRTLEAAKAEKERYRQLRLLTEIHKKSVEGETKYAVVIGDYSSRESAENAKSIVQKQCKCTPIIFAK